MKAIFRYFGSKWSLTDWIIEQFPPHVCYVELFGGSGAVLLNKPVAGVDVYNDIDLSVFNLFKVLRDEEKVGELVEAISLTPFHFEEYMEAKHSVDDPVEQARRFLVRNNMCMSPNEKRWGRHEGFRRYRDGAMQNVFNMWNGLPEEIRNVAERLKYVTLENDDAIEVARKYDSENTLFYVDPPYVKSTRYHGDYVHDFTDEQHSELLLFLTQVKGKVAISGYDCDLYDSVLSNWRMESKETKTNKGGKRIERLWMNYEPEGMLF